MSDVDWSKAGKRLRHTPRNAGQRNPDWNFVQRRWKDEVDYACDDLDAARIIRLVACIECDVPRNAPCIDARGHGMPESPHRIRCRHAAEKVIANGKAPSA